MELRKQYLKDIEKELRERQELFPKGTLRISQCRGKTAYYHREETTDHNGRYIPKRQMELAAKLAQKDYDARMLEAIGKECRAIEAYRRFYPECRSEEVYEALSAGRKAIVIPALESDAMFIQHWEEERYEGKPFTADAPEYYTEKGERVRSKSEIIIANALMKAGVPYRYEYPVYLKGFGTVYPDFAALNIFLRKTVYWEHFGMMDNEAYAENAVRKILGYERQGIYPGDQLIVTFETKNNPISMKQISGIIEHYLL